MPAVDRLDEVLRAADAHQVARGVLRQALSGSALDQLRVTLVRGSPTDRPPIARPSKPIRSTPSSDAARRSS